MNKKLVLKTATPESIRKFVDAWEKLPNKCSEQKGLDLAKVIKDEIKHKKFADVMIIPEGMPVFGWTGGMVICTGHVKK